MTTNIMVSTCAFRSEIENWLDEHQSEIPWYRVYSFLRDSFYEGNYGRILGCLGVLPLKKAPKNLTMSIRELADNDSYQFTITKGGEIIIRFQKTSSGIEMLAFPKGESKTKWRQLLYFCKQLNVDTLNSIEVHKME